MRNRKKNQELRHAFEVAGDLPYQDGIEFHAKEFDLFADLTDGAGGDPFNTREGRCEQSQGRKGALMASLITIHDFFFGCHHTHLSRVFTMHGETYRVCCDCGAKYAYSLETMSIERRLPVILSNCLK
jgi:hypothetical protein